MVNETGDNENKEYVYSEEQRIDAYPLRSPGLFSRLFAKLKQQRGLLIGIGVVLIVYVVFRIVNLAENNTTSTTTTPTGTTVVTTSTNHNVPPSIHPQIAQQLTQAQTVGNDSNARLQQIQSSLADLDQRMYNVQQVMGNLDATLRQLNNMIAQQLYRQQQREQAKLNAIRNNAAMSYKVQAIIPNRAWLVGPRGSILTVTLGTFIPGAGKVTDIDSEQGTVTTNTGAVIQYSLDDQ